MKLFIMCAILGRTFKALPTNTSRKKQNVNSIKNSLRKGGQYLVRAPRALIHACHLSVYAADYPPYYPSPSDQAIAK